MAYKIVQTVERGKLVLTAVPDQWERNGFLYWPRRKVEDYLKNPSSCPEDSWSALPCVVKRSGISTLESAEIEVTQMSTMSDTEEEHEESQRRGHLTKNIAVQECFNDLANTCVDSAQYLQSSSSNPGPSLDDVIVLTTTQEMHQNQNSVILQRAEIDQQEISQKLDNLIEITGVVQENQKILFEYLQSVESKLLLKMSQLSTQFDEYVQRTTEIKIKETKNFKPISNKEELDALEDQLKDPTMVTTLKNKLSVICGNGKGRGSNNAYALVDVMFTRQFMTSCSWAGGSKGSTSKICFKIYTRTINIFFELIQESDKTYTKIECENFFKNVMRHAETRNKIKLLRASSSKSRPKGSMSKNKISNSQLQVLQEIEQNEQSIDLCSNLTKNDTSINKENVNKET